MLNSYVNFVKGEVPETIENINLNNLLRNICESSNSNKHTITEKYIKKISTSGRTLQIKRAIQNIIDNAKRYSSNIHLELDANLEECYINISDDGPGIPVKNYEDVFKPFFTLDKSRNKLKGESGLGMTIARDIIRSHGGEIKLKESKMGGLAIIIILPL